jgi:hypothetical protein
MMWVYAEALHYVEFYLHDRLKINVTHVTGKGRIIGNDIRKLHISTNVLEHLNFLNFLNLQSTLFSTNQAKLSLATFDYLLYIFFLFNILKTYIGYPSVLN